MPAQKKVEEKQSEVQSKVVRLFTYLEKALSLDDTIVRDFRPTVTAPSPWWLADLPNDVENLQVRQFETNQTGDEENATQDEVWLRVEKKSIKPAPSVPDALNEWIYEVNPTDVPKAKEKIDRKIKFDQDETRIREFKNSEKNLHKEISRRNFLRAGLF